MHCKSLASINIPEGVTYIHTTTSAFHDCTSIKHALLPYTIGNKIVTNEVLPFCSSLTTVKIQPGTTTIHKAFFNKFTSLQTVKLPHTVKTIEEEAFATCSNLRNIEFPKNLTYVGKYAFVGCKNLIKKDLPTTVMNHPHYFLAGLNNYNHQVFLPNGPGPKHGYKGMTQCGYGPEMCGITLGQIEELLDNPLIDEHKTTMRDVVDCVIKPVIENLGISYALLVNQKRPLLAKVMVSVRIKFILFPIIAFCIIAITDLFHYFAIIIFIQHAWDERFFDFVTSLRRSGHKGPFWVCALSIYQSKGEGDSPTIAEQLEPDPDYGPFATVLRQAEQMMAVVTEKCNIYTRRWYVNQLSFEKLLRISIA